MRLVIVEDDSLIAMDLAAMVEDLGHEVAAEAHNAETAMSAVAEQEPEVVLMDVNLAHGGNGLEIARALYQRSGVKSLFISGNVGPELEKKVADMGMPVVGFLCKPVSMGELKKLLDGLA